MFSTQGMEGRQCSLLAKRGQFSRKPAPGTGPESLHEGDKGSSPDPSWRLGLDNGWG